MAPPTGAPLRRCRRRNERRRRSLTLVVANFWSRLWSSPRRSLGSPRSSLCSSPRSSSPCSLLCSSPWSRFTGAAEHTEGRLAAVELEDQPAVLDLGHLPSANIVTNSHAPNLVFRP